MLVVGERGTGKELVAARLTYLSPRWDKPFVKLNCATLAESLLDSELFGHEAGAFTGATRRRLSRFEIADGGTLFLDEIATASLAVQEKILRVIEYGSFERVGGNEVHHVDVRVIAATNVDLPALAEAGRFRSDLLDRLAFDVVTVPPLRERAEDIPLLAEHFARGMTRELGRDVFRRLHRRRARPARGISLARQCARAEERRRAQPLSLAAPGGADRRHRLRCLRLAVSAGGRRRARPRRLPARGRARPGDFLARVAGSRQLLGEALAAHHFNQRRTAAALGLTYDQLRHYLRKHQALSSRSGG